MSSSRLIPLIIASALFMENMDSTVIATSLPAIAKSLGTDPIVLKLAFTTYLLSLTVFIPVSGWMADRFGSRHVFRVAIAIFTGAFMIIGKPVLEPRVDEVLPGSAAEQAGIRKGDIIVSVDGSAIEDFSDLQRSVMTRAGDPLVVVLKRGGQPLSLTVVPKLHEEPDNFGSKVRIGLLGVKRDPMGPIRYEKMGPVKAFETGVERTWFIVHSTFSYLGKMFSGRESPDQLGGPISMAKAAGDAASMGFSQFVAVIAFLSVSIGLLNLFPIPMLDGGHLVYYAVEAVRGRPLGEAAQEWGFRIGFSLVIMLMVVGTWNDLMRVATVLFGG